MASSIFILFFSRTLPPLKYEEIVARPRPVRLAMSFIVAAIMSHCLLFPLIFLCTESWFSYFFIYSAFPSHPQTFILAITSSFTAAIAVLPYAFGSMVSGFSARSSFTALEYAARSSVAKFTLQIPRFTQSITSSSLSPDAPWRTSGMSTTSRISLRRSLSRTGVPT